MPDTRAVTCTLVAAAAFALAATLAAQPPQGQPRRPQVPDTGGRSATYDPLKTFAPYTMPQPVTAYRGADGAPGPAYWQNATDYEMHASIDPATRTLANTETITYTNNSPTPLNSLWLQVEQNTYRADARSRAFSGGSRQRAENTNTEGTVSESMELLAPAKGARPVKAEYVVSDTRARIALPTPLPRGANSFSPPGSRSSTKTAPTSGSSYPPKPGSRRPPTTCPCPPQRESCK